MKKSFQRSKLSLSLLFLFVIPFTFMFATLKPVTNTVKITTVKNLETASPNPKPMDFKMYDSLQLDELGLTRQAFIEGIKGYNFLRQSGKLENDSIFTIVDYSLPSTEKRLFVLDMENFKVLFNTYVAHGRNSGKEYARRFSNSPQSNMSSLGFYITKETYNGQHGLSLKLEGEEKGINDNAESRAIVIHCADYVSEKTIKALGYIGRSLGCPALPVKYAKPIIETIKDGSCIFVYGQSEKYRSHSSILNNAS